MIRTLASLAIAMTATSATAQSRPDGLYAAIYTNKGVMVGRLEADLTPLAVANFVGLAEGAIKNAAFPIGRPFYDGTIYHRVVPGHVIQTGAPVGGTANNAGYVYPNEINARLSHDHAGALQMANAGPNTNSSQFCVTLADRSYLDGDYIVFGEIVSGMDVVMHIVQGDHVDSVRIQRVGAKAQAYHVTDASFQALRTAAQVRVADQAVKKALAEDEWLTQNYRNVTDTIGGVATLQVARGSGTPATGPMRVRYSGKRARYLGGELDHQGLALEVADFASDSVGVPGFGTQGQAFVYTKMNPALDSVVAHMTPGERRVVIVRAAQGYGLRGLYAPEVPGKKRFVISPNTLLVYDVEVLKN